MAGVDSTCRMQVADSGSASNVAEGSNVILCPARLVEGQRMSVAVEGTAIVSTGGHATGFTDCNVTHEDSIDILRVYCIINSHREPVPVISTVDDETFLNVVFRILSGCITVDVMLVLLLK